jgi:AcrR family transcriptional regulator
MPVEVVARRRGVLRTRSRSGGVSPRVQVAEMQRARLLAAAAVAVDELGWSRVTVARIAGGARVSRRTFYDLFEDREDCLLAVLEDTVDLIVAELASVNVGVLSWRERLRAGLWIVLSFLDREPVLARVCVVQSARGSRRVLEYRERILTRLAAVLEEGEKESRRAGECPPLVAEGLAGAAVAIVYKRLLKGERSQLSGLLGDLMGMLVLPYLGPAVARRERMRPVPAIPATGACGGGVSAGIAGDDPLRALPMRLTYRTARVLDCVAEHPGASNRLVADHAGITDQGQVSKLLSRLERLGLLANKGEGRAKGEPNAWTLTLTGRQVTDSIAGHTDDPHPNGERTA